MFGVQSPVFYPPEAVHSALFRAIRSPDHVWIPISPVPHQVKDPRNLQSWSKVFPKVGAETILPKRADLEALVDSYYLMGHWDFAFLLCTAAYFGQPVVPTMDALTWQGPVGASRLWLLRGKVMIPVPNGPIKMALETWWALSGGYLNLQREFIPIDIGAFEAHFASIDSPIILTRPWDSDDPEFVMRQIQSMHVNEITYPTAPTNSQLDFEGTTEKWGALWVKGQPVDTKKVPYAPKQCPEACIEGPLGLNWLNAARDTIPPRIFARAKSLRENGYVRV